MLIKYENEIKALQSQIQRLESGSNDTNNSLLNEITLLQNAKDMLNDRIESLLKSIDGKDNDSIRESLVAKGDSSLSYESKDIANFVPL